MAAVSDPEREYQEAKAAYGAALARLKAAKAARPPSQCPYPSRGEIRDAKWEVIWQAYAAGERNYTMLAQRFGMSNVAHVESIVRQWQRGDFAERMRMTDGTA